MMITYEWLFIDWDFLLQLQLVDEDGTEAQGEASVQIAQKTQQKHQKLYFKN